MPSSHWLSAKTGLIVSLLLSCSSEETRESASTDPEVITVDTLYHFTTFEEHGIAQPTDVLLHQGLFYIADYGTDTVSVLSRDGEKIRTLGRSGEGPGEFLNIRDMVADGEEILIYDSHQYRISIYDSKGEYIEDINFSSDGLYENVHVIDRNHIISGTNGRRDHLMEMQDLRSGEIIGFGELEKERAATFDMKANIRQLESGQIPDLFQNMVIPNALDDTLYAYLESHSEILKFDREGNEFERVSVNLPHNRAIFEATVASQKRSNSSRSLSAIQYIMEFAVRKDGFYFITASAPEVPQLLVKADHSGKIRTIWQFPESTGGVYDLEIDDDGYFYLTSWSSGVVYKGVLGKE